MKIFINIQTYTSEESEDVTLTCRPPSAAYGVGRVAVKWRIGLVGLTSPRVFLTKKKLNLIFLTFEINKIDNLN